MKIIRRTAKSVEQMFEIRKELKEQGWAERLFYKTAAPIPDATEKLILYVWRWHGEWSGAQKEYCTTFYR